MAKQKEIIEQTYNPPADNKYWVYIGDKYYRRLQPIPYRYIIPEIKIIKKSFLVN